LITKYIPLEKRTIGGRLKNMKLMNFIFKLGNFFARELKIFISFSFSEEMDGFIDFLFVRS